MSSILWLVMLWLVIAITVIPFAFFLNWVIGSVVWFCLCHAREDRLQWLDNMAKDVPVQLLLFTFWPIAFWFWWRDYRDGRWKPHT